MRVIPETESLRQRKKNETRQALRRAAIDLASEQGVAATSVDEICQKAGVSSRTFFNYFPTKVAALVGGQPILLSDEVRSAYLRQHGDDQLVADTCRLVVDVLERQSSAAGDLGRRLELARETPDVMQAGLVSLYDGSTELIALVAQRIAGGSDADDRQRSDAVLVVNLVIAALATVLRQAEPDELIGHLGDATAATAERMQMVGHAHPAGR